MRKCLIILMILINILGKSNSDYILPFDTCNIGINKTLLKEDFLSNILSRHLCTDFIIGSEKEKMQAIINMTQIGFFIYDKSYNYKSSISFKFKDQIRNFYYRNNEKGYDANDTLCFIEYESNKNLNDYNINKCKSFKSVNFELLKSEEITNDYLTQYGIIGLGLHSNQDEYLLSTFIKALKDTNMTNSHYFFFNFINNKKNDINQGYLYIGGEDIDEDKGRKTKIISFPISGQMFWNLKFDKISSAIYN